MSYIQLIECASLPTSVWLTFWDLDKQHQLSLEIGATSESYVVGTVYTLDRDAQFEHLALRPVNDVSVLGMLDLLIPPPKTASTKGRTSGGTRVSVRENANGHALSHQSLLRVLA